tara:strand:- start:510 stop:1448 length:939 start_codon:yes stop_codon:yes gene_type:complete
MSNIKSTIGRLARCSINSKAISDTLSVANGSKIILEWPVTGDVAYNWGDKLNPLIAKMVSGKNPAPRQLVLNPKLGPVYYMIGSVLGFIRDPRAQVYGTGFITYEQKPLVKPQHVASVRGPLSEDKCIQNGIKAPGIYGDMALVLPEFFRPDVKKIKGRVGVISHFRERKEEYWKRYEQADFLNININEDICELVKNVLSCEYIISSSLHGLIIADAYKVPSIWVRPSEKPSGDLFKFHDYLSSVERKNKDPVAVSKQVNFSEIESLVELGSLRFSANELISVCPFGSIPIKPWSEQEINDFYTTNDFPNIK